MLILPIVNRNRILNVQITLRNAEKIRHNVNFYDANESDIIVNGNKLSESRFKDSDKDIDALNFIRFNSINYSRNYLITTRTGRENELYDVYEVAPPPVKVNDGLDNLYSRVLTDMRKEIPDTNNGRYVSFESMGIGEALTDDKISKLQRIVKEERDNTKWPMLFREAGISDLLDIVSFVKTFNCVIVSDTTIPEESLADTVRALSIINTRDYKNLNNYYTMAKDNRDIYAKLSYINQLVYGEPLNLIRSNHQIQKQLIKNQEMDIYKNA